MERLKRMKAQLIDCVEKELYNLSQANCEELGGAIDMIKDLEETIYYATITKAMSEDKQEHHYKSDEGMAYYPKMYRYYDEPKMYYDPYRDMDRNTGRMYYSAEREGMKIKKSEREHMFPHDLRDDREGRSHMTRKSYIEGKEMHLGKEKQMKELEKYMQELTNDITEMISHTSPEEKQLLQKKITTLAEKVGQVSV